MIFDLILVGITCFGAGFVASAYAAWLIGYVSPRRSRA